MSALGFNNNRWLQLNKHNSSFLLDEIDNCIDHANIKYILISKETLSAATVGVLWLG
jgi:hypothetical protein